MTAGSLDHARRQCIARASIIPWKMSRVSRSVCVMCRTACKTRASPVRHVTRASERGRHEHCSWDGYAKEAAVLMPPIGRYMTSQPWTLESGASLGDARRLMHAHGIRHLPILDDGRLVGVLSERDLLRVER